MLAERIRRPRLFLPTGLTAYLWLKGLHPELPGFSCPLRALTGIPCPTCYLTRGTCEALHGRLDSAIVLHAFAPAAALSLLLWSVEALRQGRLRPRQLQGRHLAFTALGLLAYWLVRLVLQFAFGWPSFPATG